MLRNKLERTEKGCLDYYFNIANENIPKIFGMFSHDLNILSLHLGLIFFSDFIYSYIISKILGRFCALFYLSPIKFCWK